MTYITNSVYFNLHSEDDGAIYFDSDKDLFLRFLIFKSCEASRYGAGICATCKVISVS